MSRISWSARSRGGHKASGKAEENVHIWLRGHPKTACGCRVNYLRGDDEWFTGDPARSGCPKCCKIVGYRDRVPLWPRMKNNVKEHKARPLLKYDKLAGKRAAYHSRRAAGICVECLEPSPGYVRCFKCRTKHLN